MLECSPIVNSRIRLRISSSISVISERLMSGSTSCSRVLMRAALSECCLPACRQAIRVEGWSWNGSLFDDVFHHGIGGQSVAGRVGTQPEPMAEHVLRKILDVLRIDLVPAAHEQRPDFGQTSPHDDGAGRRAEI